MNEGFNLLENFPINKEFSFFKELEKLGFRKLDDPQKDQNTQYIGTIYDYETDSLAKIIVEREERSFAGCFSKYIQIYKNHEQFGKCIYNGFMPQSYIVFHTLMTHLFPTKDFALKYENKVLVNEVRYT